MSTISVLDILNSRVKRSNVDGYSYKLVGEQYGLDVVIPNEMDIDEQGMSVWIPFAEDDKGNSSNQDRTRRALRS